MILSNFDHFFKSLFSKRSFKRKKRRNALLAEIFGENGQERTKDVLQLVEPKNYQ